MFLLLGLYINVLYRVSVRGDGLNPIVDVDDLVLDGDADGSPGGNFVSQFTVFSPVG
jgi:hypothetical protein